MQYVSPHSLRGKRVVQPCISSRASLAQGFPNGDLRCFTIRPKQLSLHHYSSPHLLLPTPTFSPMHFHCFLGFQTLNAAWSTDQMSHRETVICASWSLDYRGTMVAVEISLASKRGEMAFSPNPDVTKISLFRTASVLQHVSTM